MKSWEIYCTICGKVASRDHKGFQCVCGGPQDVNFAPRLNREQLRSVSSLWRYRDAIPLEDDEFMVSLGEGMTPVVEEAFDGEIVTLKLEYLAPTGSFKDRGAAVLMSRLKEMGIDEILEDSSGNAGCSLAAYAAAAGIRCRVLVPENVSRGKAVQISSHGAVLERFPGTRDEVAAEALRRAEQMFYASHNWQPFFLQGTKTFAYEVFEQVTPLPDAIFFPIGNGSLLLGSHKGFKEMKALGWVDKIPRLVGVQAASHSPIYAEVTENDSSSSAGATIAKGIAIGKPARLSQVAATIRDSEGTAVVVGDDEIRRAQRDLALRGYLVEPTSAAALAGYRRWRANRTNQTGGPGKVLMPLTGTGLKDLESFEQM